MEVQSVRNERMGSGQTSMEAEKPVRMAEWVGKHHQALRKYCRLLAGSIWEGDDLAQDTWLKVWSAMLGKSHEDGDDLNRTYLYRVARNAWIDRSRKKRVPTVNAQILEELRQPESSAIEVWSAMETLVSRLSPVQRTSLLLVDVLKYTAAEAAQLTRTTEGAVKAALHRARTKLKGIMAETETYEKDHAERPSNETSESDKTDDLLLHAYMEAFRKQNTEAMVMLMNDGVAEEAIVSILNAQVRKQTKLPKAQFMLHSNSTLMQLAA